jgi:putative ABC transport system ATP-binding protein
MIQFKNVERSYKTGAGQTWVLRRIDLTIQEGEFVTIMGPSGAGKSSLLNVLALLDDQWAGEYWFGEQPVHLMKRKDRAELAKRKIGMVFQSYHLLDDLTVQENIDLPLSYKDIPRSQRQGMVAETLDHFQIVAKKDLYPNQLSGGQQQLVGIARAVIHKPALLLADEPTGNLHSSQATEIMELFTQLNREGTTIVQVTHSDVNASYGSRIIQLRDGWLVDDTRPSAHEGTHDTVPGSDVPALPSAGQLASADTGTDSGGARADAQCANAAAIGERAPACAAFDTHAGCIGHSSFAQPVRRVCSQPGA